MKKLLLPICFCCMFFPSYSQLGGKSIYTFLELPVPARTAALAGNTIGIKDDDVTLSFQNPASLNNGMDNQLSMSYVNYIADVNYSYAAYARSYKKADHFAIGLQNIGYGKFQETDEYGQVIGSFKASDMSFNLSYAHDLDSNLTYGVTLKTIYSNYYNYKSVGNAIDAGLTYKGKKRFGIVTVLLKNFGYQWKTYTGGPRERLPFDFQIGGSYKVPKAPFRLVASFQSINQWDLRSSTLDPSLAYNLVDPFTKEPVKQSKTNLFFDNFFRHTTTAVEIILTKNFHIDLGFNFRRYKELRLADKWGGAGFTTGIGFKISKFQFSYGYARYSMSGNSSHITVTTNLSAFVKEKK